MKRTGPEACECPTAGESRKAGDGDADDNDLRSRVQARDPNQTSKHLCLLTRQPAVSCGTEHEGNPCFCGVRVDEHLDPVVELERDAAPAEQFLRHLTADLDTD
jgi:hypothetical protein